jgi:hypothetical protein
MLNDSRQAGVQTTVKISPDMVQAGVCALRVSIEEILADPARLVAEYLSCHGVAKANSG